MKITTAKYLNNGLFPEKKNAHIQAEIDGESSCVPLDPANIHYAEIMRQVDAGELTIEPADE